MTRTSKMPGLSYSLPAWECKTGSKLRKVKNSVCSMCYALKGNYTRYKAIKAAQYVRLKAINHQLWTAAMVAQVKRQKYFRWHDAGDVQSLVHLNKIYEVCRLTPDTNHWMPTREAWIKDHLAEKPKESSYPILSANDQPAQRQLAKFFNGSPEGCNLPRTFSGRQV